MKELLENGPVQGRAPHLHVPKLGAGVGAGSRDPPHLGRCPSLMFSRVCGQRRALAGRGVPVTLPTPAGTRCSLTPEI